MEEEEEKEISLEEAARKGLVDQIPKLIQSKEDLNRLKYGRHCLGEAIRYNQMNFVFELHRYAEENGWKIDFDSIDTDYKHPFFSAIADNYHNRNDYKGTQFLATHYDIPKWVYFQAGEGSNSKTNQYLFALIALTNNPKAQHLALSEALANAVTYDSALNYQRFTLLLELGANPHHIHKEEYGRKMPIIHKAFDVGSGTESFRRSEKMVEHLLKALNSYKIYHELDKYITSMQDFFLTESGDKQHIGAGFLHWAAAAGHTTLLFDIASSFREHDCEELMFVRDDDGMNPIDYAIDAALKHRAEKEKLEAEGKDEEAEEHAKEERKYLLLSDMLLRILLKNAYSVDLFVEPRDNFLKFVLEWLDIDTINNNIEFYLDSIKEFYEGDKFTDENDKEHPAASGLLHWAAAQGHVEIIDEIIKIFQKIGITIHPKNRVEKTPFDVANDAAHEESEEITKKLKAIPADKPKRKVKTLMELTKDELLTQIKENKLDPTLLEDERKGLPKDILDFLDEVKPNFRFMPILSREFNTEPGQTPLMVMCNKGKVELIERFLPFLTAKDIAEKDYDDENIFHKACREGNSDVIRLLTDQLHQDAEKKAEQYKLSIKWLNNAL